MIVSRSSIINSCLASRDGHRERKKGREFVSKRGESLVRGFSGCSREKKSSLVKVTVSTLENSANGTGGERGFGR